MGNQRNAVVIGGGIAGLTSAIGLHLTGFRVTVLERAAELADAGSGITLWPNALRGLQALGLGERIRPLAGQGGGIRGTRGQWLLRWNSTKFQRVFDGSLLALHRAQLIEILREALPESTLRTGTYVSSVNQNGLVQWDNEAIAADLVVGADGIHSETRKNMWPEYPGPVPGGATAFRAVLDDPGTIGSSPGITLGPGAEFGIVPLNDGRLYWYAALKASAQVRVDPKSFLRFRFRSWHPEVGELIERTPADRILHNDLYQLGTPLPRYNKGRLALVGDAAHAMPPFLGQGGGQAIEDAVELTSVAGSDDLPTALVRYDARRRARSQAIARQSVRAGKMGVQLQHPLAIAGRNAVLRMIPAELALRRIAADIDWTPPAISVEQP